MTTHTIARIGLLPAAGFATRLGVSQSKACLAIAPQRHAADCLLSAYQQAQLDHGLFLHREAQHDIHTHYQHDFHGLALRYRTVAPTPSTVHTLAEALRQHPKARFFLGFPDIQFQAEQPFAPLESLISDEQADISLGLFYSQRPDKVDMVSLDHQQSLRELVIKDTNSTLRHCWALACWGPRFSECLLDFAKHTDTDTATIDTRAPASEKRNRREYFLGDVIMAAQRAGLSVKGQVLNDKTELLDIGTPEDLAKASDYWASSGD